MKLQPYVQSSVMPRSHQKLSFKYFGPYQVAARVGEVAYRLQLPSSSRIHPVIHVSQLKLVAGFKGVASSSLTASLPDFNVPVQVLQTCGVTKGHRLVQQVLVAWSGLPHELATWEDRDALHQRFPFAPAWGQADFQERGSVDKQALSEAEQSSSAPRGRGARTRRPNPRVVGPDWV
jgi:hypothetical protein